MYYFNLMDYAIAHEKGFYGKDHSEAEAPAEKHARAKWMKLFTR